MKRRFFLLFPFCVFSSIILAQHQDKVDYTLADIAIQIYPNSQTIEGTVIYDFDVLSDVDSVFLDARNMDFTTILLNKKKVKYTTNGQTLSIYKKLKKGKDYSLTLKYKAKPKQTVYFLGFEDDIDGNEQVWTQGQGKYSSHWVPSFDDMMEKVEFDLTITFDATYEVIANGKLQDVQQTGELKTWSYDMQQPMSSYLLAFAIGKYTKQELISTSGIPIANYYYPQDSLRVEPTYRYTEEIFDFLEDEIGVPYPWQNYKQIPVHDFLYAGMENTGTTIFSDAYVIDSIAFVDKNYVNVNAHEMAHQWFGNLVTEKDGHHHWLHEGFATHYAYLAEKELFGDDHYYWKLFDTATELNELSENEKGEALINPKASSLTFYEKGAWALVMLRELVGEDLFREGIKNFLEKHKFKSVTIEDFLSIMEKVSNKNLAGFKQKWLLNKDFPWEETKTYLMSKSGSIRYYYVLKHMNDIVEMNWLDEVQSSNLKQQLVKEFREEITMLGIKQLLLQKDLKVRQLAAQITTNVDYFLKEDFESLLNDKSYITQELALYNLWVSFPEERIRYLDQTMKTIGLPNKNLRLLWLTLALITPDYNEDQKQDYFNRLSAYTSPAYNFEVRQLAFQYLHQINALNEVSITNLIKATNHHSWQFRKYGRNLINGLLEDEDQRKRIIFLSKKLKDDELRYLTKKLNEE